jgi:hypothetical protein
MEYSCEVILPHEARSGNTLSLSRRFPIGEKDKGVLSVSSVPLTHIFANRRIDAYAPRKLFRGKDVESASILASSFFPRRKNETKMCLVQLENVHVTFNVLKRILQERTFSRLNVNVSFVFSCLILPKKNFLANL